VQSLLRKLRRQSDDAGTVTGHLAKSYRENARLAARHWPAVLRDRREMQRYRQTLAGIARRLPEGKGIAAIHFVYGLKQVEDFPFFAFMAILSAQTRHPNAETFVHIHFEPVGEYWQAIRDRVTIVRVPNFEWYGMAPVKHYAHKSDVVRMMALVELGGLYLDCDTVTLSNMDDLVAAHSCILGVQPSIPGAMGGFCNAIMLARRKSRFMIDWLSHYRSFNSKGRDIYWDFHSVKLPVYLYSVNSEGVHILKHDKWFFPLWNHINYVMFSSRDLDQNRELLDGQLAIHLWHNILGRTLENWTAEIAAVDQSLYGEVCRKVVADMSEAAREEMAAKLGVNGRALFAPTTVELMVAPGRTGGALEKGRSTQESGALTALR